MLTDCEPLALGDCDALAEPDELTDAIGDIEVLTDADTKPDGVTYELWLTWCEGLILDVIDGDFDGNGVDVSEYTDDIDNNGDEDTDTETLTELVELGEAELDRDDEPELDGDNVPETDNLLVTE